ncbi:unnamed protein product, partial [Laminaria digitata]
MSRTKRTPASEEEQDLNLAPIMNMVVILIPLLLLSVVFVSVSVINVNSPSLAPGKQSDDVGEEPEKLTVSIASGGFYVATRAGNMAPLVGCPKDGPTICLIEPGADTREEFSRARALLERGDSEQGSAILEDAVGMYDWRQLYNTLADLKKRNPKIEVINVSADAHIPHAAVI